MKLVQKQIGCPNLIALIYKLIRVDKLLPNGDLTRNRIGTPQGSVLSPILSNIILHEFDVYLTNILIPGFEQGKSRRRNPEYTRLT